MLSTVLNSVVIHLLGTFFSNQILQNIVESSFGYLGKIKVNLELGQKLQSL